MFQIYELEYIFPRYQLTDYGLALANRHGMLLDPEEYVDLKTLKEISRKARVNRFVRNCFYIRSIIRAKGSGTGRGRQGGLLHPQC